MNTEETSSVERISIADKKTFIIKVYRIFIYSLLFSALTSYAGVQLGLQFSWWWALLDMGVFIACLIIRDNLFLLYFWSSISGFTSVPILSEIIGVGQVDIVWKAILVTAILFVILSVYVYSINGDFSHWRAILFTLLTVLVLSIIPLLFFPDKTAEWIWCLVGIFVCSSYVLFDTSEVLNRREPGEEIMAAMDLHLDFVNLIWDFIRIFKRTNTTEVDTIPGNTIDSEVDITTDVD